MQWDSLVKVWLRQRLLEHSERFNRVFEVAISLDEDGDGPLYLHRTRVPSQMGTVKLVCGRAGSNSPRRLKAEGTLAALWWIGSRNAWSSPIDAHLEIKQT
jgi:hypothetical protein